VALSAREEAVFPGGLSIKRVKVKNAEGKDRNGYRLVIAEGTASAQKAAQAGGKVGEVGQPENIRPYSSVTTASCGTGSNTPTLPGLCRCTPEVGARPMQGTTSSYTPSANLPTSSSEFVHTSGSDRTGRQRDNGLTLPITEDRDDDEVSV
jgi:hypothetical protein